jgi:hypothetical protein
VVRAVVEERKLGCVRVVLGAQRVGARSPALLRVGGLPRLALRKGWESSARLVVSGESRGFGVEVPCRLEEGQVMWGGAPPLEPKAPPLVLDAPLTALGVPPVALDAPPLEVKVLLRARTGRRMKVAVVVLVGVYARREKEGLTRRCLWVAGVVVRVHDLLVVGVGVRLSLRRHRPRTLRRLFQVGKQFEPRRAAVGWSGTWEFRFLRVQRGWLELLRCDCLLASL